MHKLTLFYSVRNGGDGSAYPTFMSTQALANYDQNNMSEGWGGSCTGSITLKSDSPITIEEEIETPESYLVNLINDDPDGEDVDKFIKEFFPKGKPKFEVKTREVEGEEKYLYNDVYINGVKVAEAFRNVEVSGQAFENTLNK